MRPFAIRKRPTLSGFCVSERIHLELSASFVRPRAVMLSCWKPARRDQFGAKIHQRAQSRRGRFGEQIHS